MAVDPQPRTSGLRLRVAACAVAVVVVALVVLAEREPSLRLAHRILTKRRSPAWDDAKFGPGAFVSLQIAAVLFTLLLTAACVRWAAPLTGLISGVAGAIGGAAVQAWRAFCRLHLAERAAWAGMVVAFALQRLFDAVSVPLHCDEIRTYLGTVSHGPLVAFTIYRDPNNHVLHSLLAAVSVWLPLPVPLDLRLPAVLAGVGALVALAAALRSVGPAIPSLLAVLAMAALPPVVYYAASARGYSLCLLLAVLGAWATTRLVEDHAPRRWRGLFVLACGLGAATIPTHVYCVGALVLVRSAFALADRRRDALIATWIDGALSGAVAVMFYSGIFARSGVASVTGNSFVRSRTFADVAESLPRHVGWVGRWMLEIDVGSALIPVVIVVAALLLWSTPREERRLRCLAAVALAFGLSVIVFPFAQRVIPPARNWIHVAIAPPLCLFVALVRLRLLARPAGAGIALAVIAATVVSGELGSRASHTANRSDAMLRRIDEWLEERDIRDVFASSRLAANSLRFHSQTRGRERVITDSTKWNPTDPDVAFGALREHPSTVALVGELRVLPPPEVAVGYELAYEDGDFGVWLRRP